MVRSKNLMAIKALCLALVLALFMPLCAHADDIAASSDETCVSKENSWRYENGVLRADLGETNEDDADIDTQAMHQMPSGATAQGIDVSGYQKDIDWQAVKNAGIDFAIIKIGNLDESEQDGWYTDSRFLRNVTECERLGIPYGVYVYAYGKSTWAYQNGAEHIISLLKGHHPSLPVYLDLEDDSINPGKSNITKNQLVEFSKAFCNRIAAAGYYPGIYSGASWFKSYLTDSCFTSGEWSIWTAQYWYSGSYNETLEDSPEYPKAGEYDIWQYSSIARVNGITGYTDINYCYVDWNNVTGDGVKSFSDVKSDTPHADDITWLGDNGISTGWIKFGGRRTFRPYNKVARADVAAFLYRLAGSPDYTAPETSPFKDVSKNTAHYKEICWLASTGIAEGWSDGTFRPNDEIARCDMAAFLYRLAGSPTYAVKDDPFVDCSSETPHYKEVCWLANTGVSEGWTVSGGKEFRAYNKVARADMAAFLHRLNSIL